MMMMIMIMTMIMMMMVMYHDDQVENGIVRNWEDMEHLWNYTFYDKMQVGRLVGYNGAE
jgi:hypothetical protein